MAPRELWLTWRHVRPGGAVATLPPKPARGLPGIVTSIKQTLAHRGAEQPARSDQARTCQCMAEALQRASPLPSYYQSCRNSWLE